MKTKALLIAVVLLGLAPITFIVWIWWDSAHNHGLTFGYYGDFNRVRHALDGIPGVSITREWANTDISLEEFGFNITTPLGQAIHLDIQESDPTRNLAGERLISALADKINAKTSSPRADR